MNRLDADAATSGAASERALDQLAVYIDAASDSGIFHDGARLSPSAERVWLTVERGERTITRGASRGDAVLVASYAIVSLPSIERATDVAARLASALGGDVEIEISPIRRPWELEPSATPAASPQFLLLQTITREIESGAAPTSPPAVTRLLLDLASDGILWSKGLLQPSRRGARLGSDRNWTDGPLAGSRAPCSGYAVVERESLDEAKTWAEDYAAILGSREVDVRELCGDDPHEPGYSLRDGWLDPRLV